MHVAGRDQRLFQLGGEARHAAVEVAQALVVAHRAVFHEEAVVRDGHDLYVVVERGYLLELRVRRAAQHGVEHLARLAGGAYEQPLAVPLQQAARDYRVAVVVLEVGGGDELVEVLEAHLVAHQQADVPHLARARARELAQHAVYVRDALRAVALQHGDELLHHARDDLGVVKGTVVVEGGQAQVLADDIQLVALELRQQALGEHQRVEHHGLEVYAAPLAGGGHEAGVEASVVRDYGPVAHEVEEGAHGLRLARRPGDVAVADAGELRDVRGYGHLRVHEGAELVAHLAALEEHRADLGQAVRHRGEARGLHVEGDELAVEQAVALAAHGGALLHVVYVVALYAVEYLDAVLLPRLAHLGEGLGRAVVGDGYGLVTPGGGALHGLRRVGQRVERRVAGVEVELHALFLGGVRAQLGLGLDYRVGLDDHVVVELVVRRPAADYERRAGLYLAEDGGVLALVEEFVDADAAGVVGHVKAEHRGAALLNLAVVDGKDLALDDDGAALEVERGHLHRLGLLERLAEEHAGGAALALRPLAGVVRGDAHGGEAELLAELVLEPAQLRRGGGAGEAGLYLHRPLRAVDHDGADLGLVEAAAHVAQRGAVREDLEEAYAARAHSPSPLSMSSMSAEQSSLSGTLRTISPFLKSRPQPLPPATP